MDKSQLLPDSYPGLLQELKQRIQESQRRASIFVNGELVLLYWRMILQQYQLLRITRHGR